MGVIRLSRLLALGSLFCAAAMHSGVTHADSAYIIDEIVVSLRDAPCSGCRVVHRGIRSGQQVKILETGDGWTRVEASEGRAGWLPSRYLTDQPIARDQLAALRDEIERLRAENLRLGQNAPAATADGAAMKEPGFSSSDTLSARDGADSASDLYTQNQALLTRNKMLQSEIDVLHATREELQSNDIQRWFIFGGLLVALGALLGMVLPLLKPKRRGYSEWS